SSYSFHSKLSTGEMTLPQVIDWISESEGEHLELAVLGDDPDSPIPNIASDPAYVDRIREHAAAAGVPLTNLAIGADLSAGDPAQVARVKEYVDLAARLGITRMRHDVVPHAGHEGDDTPLFEQVLPHVVAASKEIGQAAASPPASRTTASSCSPRSGYGASSMRSTSRTSAPRWMSATSCASTRTPRSPSPRTCPTRWWSTSRTSTSARPMPTRVPAG